jgi:HD domain
MGDMKNIQEPESVSFLHLTARFTRAIDYARQVHVNCRKGTSIPYMAHLLGVAALVMGENGHVPFPVTEDMVIGALLHDAVEDEGGVQVWTVKRSGYYYCADDPNFKKLRPGVIMKQGDAIQRGYQPRLDFCK